MNVLFIISFAINVVLAQETASSFTVINEANIPIVVYWIDPYSPSDYVPISETILSGSEGTVNAFSDHQFVIGRLESNDPKDILYFSKAPIDEVLVVRYNRISKLELYHFVVPFDYGTIAVPGELQIKNTANVWLSVFEVNPDGISEDPSTKLLPHLIPPYSQHILESCAPGTAFIFTIESKSEKGGIRVTKGAFDETVTFWQGNLEDESVLYYDSSSEYLDSLEVQTVAGFLTSSHSLRASITSAYMDMYSHLSAVVDMCQTSDDSSGFMSDKEVVDCIAVGGYEVLQSEIDTQTKLNILQESLSRRLREYVCADTSLNTTSAITSHQEAVHDRFLRIDTLLHKEHARIWTIDEFVSPEECSLLRSRVDSRLQEAVTLGGMKSESRRARQAGYVLMGETDPLWHLYQRILNFTNTHTNYAIEVDGQEHMTVIQYNRGDEYVTHCDGICDGSPYFDKGRVATAVLYCETAEVGGGTTFSRSDIFIKPTPGQVTFFTYKGEDGFMDEGLTEHSGCPVEKGEKWIATAWLRQGVSLLENAYLFDGFGRRKLPP